MKRLALLASLALACVVLVPLPVVSQWQRAEVDGISGCQNIEQGFFVVPKKADGKPYRTKGDVTQACNAFNSLFSWMGTAEALTLRCITNADGSCTTLYRAGDKPQGGGDTGLAGFTEEAYGTAECQYDDLGAGESDDIRITKNTGDGVCVAYVAFSNEDNLQITSCPAHSAGSSAPFASGAVYVAEGGTDFANDIIHASRRTPGSATGYVILDLTGIFDWTQMPYEPDCVAVTHVAATNVTTLWGSEDDGATYDIIDTTTADLGAGRVGIYVQTPDAITSSSFDFENVNFTNTPNLVDGGGGGEEPGQAPPNPFTNLPGGPAWLHGLFHVIEGTGGFDSFHAWMGHQSDIVGTTLAYSGSPCASTWTQFQASPTNSSCNFLLTQAMDYFPDTTPMVVTMTMVPTSHSNQNCARPATWTEMAAGNYDANWTTFFTNLRTLIDSRGKSYDTVVLRMGWELNGYWYQHSVCNAVADHKTAWSRVVGIARGIMPGIKFEYSPAFTAYMGQTAGGGGSVIAGNVNLAAMLPDSDDYDFIGVSYHDDGINNESDWISKWYAPSSNRIGLAEFFSTAQAVGKLMAISEYATQIESCGAPWVASPNPGFVLTKLAEFLNSVGDWIAYTNFFSIGCTRLYTPTSRRTSAGGLAYAAGWDPP